MRRPPLSLIGLATLVTAAFALTGCDNGGTATPAASGSANATVSGGTADPAAVAALATATAQLGSTSFRISAASGAQFRLTATVDPPHSRGTAELVVGGGGNSRAVVTIRTLLVGQDLYVQVPGVADAGNWIHLDVARLSADANVGLRPGRVDPVNTARLLGSSTDVHADGPRSYSGTLDISQAVGLAGLNQATIDQYGAVARQVPFTAVLDGQGRLQTLTINLPPVNGQRIDPVKVDYTDYGTPVTVSRPAPGQVAEAPNSVYQLLGH